MIRLRSLLSLLMIVLITTVQIQEMTASKKSSSINDNHKITKEVRAYASEQKIDVSTALYRLELQELAATLIRVHKDNIDLSQNGDSGAPWFVANTAYGIHIGGIGDDAYYMAINYIDYLNLSVLTTTTSTITYLPIIWQNPFQSISVVKNTSYVMTYPAPNSETPSS